jgi:hypothetical protein
VLRENKMGVRSHLAALSLFHHVRAFVLSRPLEHFRPSYAGTKSCVSSLITIPLGH